MGGGTELTKDDDGLSSPTNTQGPSPPALIKWFRWGHQRTERVVDKRAGHNGGRGVVGATGEGKKIVST